MIEVEKRARVLMGEAFLQLGRLREAREAFASVGAWERLTGREVPGSEDQSAADRRFAWFSQDGAEIARTTLKESLIVFGSKAVEDGLFELAIAAFEDASAL